MILLCLQSRSSGLARLSEATGLTSGHEKCHSQLLITQLSYFSKKNHYFSFLFLIASSFVRNLNSEGKIAMCEFCESVQNFLIVR